MYKILKLNAFNYSHCSYAKHLGKLYNRFFSKKRNVIRALYVFIMQNLKKLSIVEKTLAVIAEVRAKENFRENVQVETYPSA